MAYGTLAADNIQSSSAGTTPPKFLNNVGTELGQLCKAWVNFDGTLAGTITPRANFNISSVTKNATGDYTLNFTNAMGDANYAFIPACRSVNTNAAIICGSSLTAPTTTALRVIAGTQANTATDEPIIAVGIFGN